MQTLKTRTSWLAIMSACALAGCVEARSTDGQGTGAFIGGRPTSSLDYGAGGGVGGAGGMSTGGTGGTGGSIAGTGGSLPPNPMAGAGGSGGVAGTGMITSGTGGDGASGISGGVGGAGSITGGGDGGSAGTEAGGGAGGEAGAGTATAGMLTLEFMSVGNGGEYAPRNCGAVWIETSSGTFVKTIERWAGIRSGHLTKWTQASGGWGGGGFFFATGGGDTADQMDAISTATLRTQQMHSPTWNMKDTMGMVVPDGTYRVMIEVTESERVSSVVASVEFEKGPAPVSMSPSDEGSFKDLTLSYTP